MESFNGNMQFITVSILDEHSFSMTVWQVEPPLEDPWHEELLGTHCNKVEYVIKIKGPSLRQVLYQPELCHRQLHNGWNVWLCKESCCCCCLMSLKSWALNPGAFQDQEQEKVLPDNSMIWIAIQSQGSMSWLIIQQSTDTIQLPLVCKLTRSKTFSTWSMSWQCHVNILASYKLKLYFILNTKSMDVILHLLHWVSVCHLWYLVQQEKEISGHTALLLCLTVDKLHN